MMNENSPSWARPAPTISAVRAGEGNTAAEGDDIGGDLVAGLRFGDDNAGDERAERDREAEGGGAGGDAERAGDKGEDEELAAAGAGDERQEAGEQAGAEDEHETDEDRGVDDGDGEGAPEVPFVAWFGGREHGEGGDGDEVLGDEPANGDARMDSAHETAVLERADEDDGGGDAHGKAKGERFTGGEAEGVAQGGASSGCERDLDDGARDGDAADGVEVGQVEVEADTEHEEDDAKVGELS